jgi:hypothetical protein
MSVAMTRHPLLTAIAVVFLCVPRSIHAQACVGSPNYAFPALFVSAQRGASGGDILHAVTARAATRYVIGGVHLDRIHEQTNQWSTESVGFSLTGQIPLDAFRGVWICPMYRVDYRGYPDRETEYLIGPVTIRYAHESRYSTDVSYGLGFALPIPLTHRFNGVLQLSGSQLNVTYRDDVRGEGWQDRRRLHWDAVVWGAGVGLSWNEAVTLAYSVSTLNTAGDWSSPENVPPRHRNDAITWQFAIGYHFAVRKGR